MEDLDFKIFILEGRHLICYNLTSTFYEYLWVHYVFYTKYFEISSLTLLQDYHNF